jgi:nucleotide-binding universal stress UspA family protein
MKTLLVPIDFSTASEAALRYALSMAARGGGYKVVALHVVTLPVYPFADGMIVPPVAAVSDLLSLAGRELDAVCARNRRDEVKLDPVVVTGAPDDAILRYADDHHCDLIVMGTHGRTGFRHLVLGSVTERVVRAAKIPVLTMRSESAVSSSAA